MIRLQIRLLTLFSFFNALRFGAPLLILYFSDISGSFALGMSVFSVTSLAQIAAEVPTGVLSDRVGRKPTVVLGSAISLLFTLCYALGLSYWYLAAGAALEGLARAVFSGNGDALLYETLAEAGEEARYAEVTGTISAAEQAAFGVAALVGGVIAVWSLQLAFWLTLVPQAIALALALCLREPRVAHRRAGGGHLAQAFHLFARNGRIRLLTLASALKLAVGEAAYQFRPAFILLVWPAWALGITQALSNIVGTTGFYLAGRVLDRFGTLRVLIVDIVFGRLLSLSALLLPSALSPVLLSLTGLTYGPGQVATSTLLQREFSDRQRATMGSLSGFAGNIGFAVGAVALGLLADRAGVVTTLVIAQVALLGVAWFYLRLFKHGRQPMAQSG